jgi:hypothetical protein
MAAYRAEQNDLVGRQQALSFKMRRECNPLLLGAQTAATLEQRIKVEFDSLARLDEQHATTTNKHHASCGGQLSKLALR